MGELDLREKNLFAIDTIFAALLNAFLIPKGAQPIRPEDITDAPTEIVTLVRGGVVHRFRDIFKCVRDRLSIGLAFLGLENQTHFDKDMPMRIMAYDALSYCRQFETLKPGEKLLPVVTFVLYFGYDKCWNGPRSLSECFEVPEQLKPFFCDYSIHVIELAWLTDEEIDRLTGDLKTLARCLRSFREHNFKDDFDDTIEHPDAVLRLLEKITGESSFKKMRQTYSEKENLRMCEIFEAMRNNYKMIGKEEGLREGKEEGLKKGLKKGKEEGLREGKKEGKKEGKEEGLKKGLKKGKEEGLREGKRLGKVEQLKTITKRVMSKNHATLEEAMSYLQLSDTEKNLVRTAMA